MVVTLECGPARVWLRRASMTGEHGGRCVMVKPSMVMRSIRVPLALWAAARVKADERQENISDVIRDALERYVKRR